MVVNAYLVFYYLAVPTIPDEYIVLPLFWFVWCLWFYFKYE